MSGLALAWIALSLAGCVISLSLLWRATRDVRAAQTIEDPQRRAWAIDLVRSGIRVESAHSVIHLLFLFLGGLALLPEPRPILSAIVPWLFFIAQGMLVVAGYTSRRFRVSLMEADLGPPGPATQEEEPDEPPP